MSRPSVHSSAHGVPGEVPVLRRSRRRALLQHVSREKAIHSLTAQYYETLVHRINLSTVIVMALCTIMSFGGLFYDSISMRDMLSMGAGALAAFATVLHSVQGSFEIGNKAHAYATCAQKLSLLEQKLQLSLRARPDRQESAQFFEAIEITIIEVNRTMAFFGSPPQSQLEDWTKTGKLAQSYDHTDDTVSEVQGGNSPLPEFLGPWIGSLSKLGVQKTSDLRYLELEELDKVKPPMSSVIKKKIGVLRESLNHRMAPQRAETIGPSWARPRQGMENIDLEKGAGGGKIQSIKVAPKPKPEEGKEEPPPTHRLGSL